MEPTTYCLILTTSPCLTSNEWAAWTQAILTVATFVTALIYQAVKDRRARQIAEIARLKLEIAQGSAEVQRLRLTRELYVLVRARLARRWSDAIRKHLWTKFESAAAEVRALRKVCEESLTLDEDLADIQKYGELGVSTVRLMRGVERLAHTASQIDPDHLCDVRPEQAKELLEGAREILQGILSETEQWLIEVRGQE